MTAPGGFQLARESETFIDHIGPVFYRPNEKDITLYLRIERRHTQREWRTAGS